ncbi:MAG: pyridoxamine 5'-phosphate oxidase family protein [Desulfobacteraceae bacterium]|nr:pyridoxamine 5'-phosphate oxidase family protein [Desulfobacteraceae bacterium]MBC2757433.1 pyridoxamine 5'-phosphate oxidase family protein [Desulfobacteraceae bacterium]MBC2763837.1 pyridoxamine 5'-phosphate oxidase family protein [ANME-2 cluster archaeon]
MAYHLKEFDNQTIEAFAPAEKIGLVASVNPDGLPHITLITSIGAAGPKQVVLGEFCKGNSKSHIQKNPKIGFLVLTMDRKMWRGHAKWTHFRKEGPEYEIYNDQPMFRYNAYLGINTVHYLDLIDAQGPDGLPLPKIIFSALMTKIAKGGVASESRDRILTSFGEDLFNRLDALKFIAYIREDGYPEIVPLLQCQAADSRRLAFSTMAYKEELQKIPPGQTVAVFGLTMKMEDVMVRGTFREVARSRGIQTATVDIRWVYNSMPPCHGQIYPPVKLEPVTEWGDF